MTEKAKENSSITVEVFYRFGTWRVRLRCQGEAIMLAPEDEDDLGGKILEQFTDRMQQSYCSGNNVVTFAATSVSNNVLLLSILSFAAAMIASTVIMYACDAQQEAWIVSNLIYPIMLLFTKCMQTVVVPVAFFSLAAFIVNLYRTLDQSRRVASLTLRYFISSVFSMGIGLLVVVLSKRFSLNEDLSAFQVAVDNFMGRNVGEILMNTVPSNIVEPFLSSNPLPMLVVATFSGLAAAKLLGSSGDKIRSAINGVSDFFCCMIGLIYNTIPVFAFFAQVYLFMQYGITGMLLVIRFLLLLFVVMLLVALFDLARLSVVGISIPYFFRCFSDVMRENLKIASNIDAMPYNKRVLLHRTSFHEDYLKDGLAIGALMNMDGNCAVISAGILFLTDGIGMELRIGGILWIGLIIILLSLGAPNQPGSFLMSMTMLMLYVGVSTELYAGILIVEAFLCKFYSFLNSAGDIVTILIEDRYYQRSVQNKTAEPK